MRQKAFAAALLLVGLAGTILPASAGTRIPTGRAAIPPAGFISFCAKYLQECRGAAQASTVVELTNDRWRQLEAVQAKVNASIVPREDPQHSWDYAREGYGDCNKFALGKRLELIQNGWPREALLLATATTETGEGHLVLIVRTTGGDIALDNRLKRVVDWSTLPYHWISMQTPESPVKWVSIVGQTFSTADASHALADRYPSSSPH